LKDLVVIFTIQEYVTKIVCWYKHRKSDINLQAVVTVQKNVTSGLLTWCMCHFSM